MPALTYSVSDFQAFTKIRSADVNARFTDISTLLNTTKLDSDNLQDNGVGRGKLAAGTADHVIINDGSGDLSSEAILDETRGGTGISPTFANNAGKALTVNSGETAFELGTPTVGRLGESWVGDVSTMNAGEDISANEAVCVIINNDEYRIMLADSNSSFGDYKTTAIGFATAAATITQGVQTWTNDGAVSSGDSVMFTINGRSYVENFDTDNDTTMTNLATTIQSDPDVDTATAAAGSDKRVVTINHRGALTVTVSVTGNAWSGGSAPNVAIATSTAPAGATVTVRTHGLLGGFSSLTLGAAQYVSTTAGGITENPSDSSPKFLGRAISATTVYVTQDSDEFKFPTAELFIKSHGADDDNAPNTASASTEHFNFTSWSTETGGNNATAQNQQGEGAFNGFHYVVDGINSSDTPITQTEAYNKVSWTTKTTRSTAKQSGGIGALSGKLAVWKGSTGSAPSGAVNSLETWNDSSWTTEGTGGTGGTTIATFVEGGKVRAINGFDSGGSNILVHDTWNGTSFATDTNPADNSPGSGQGRSPDGGMFMDTDASNSTGREWNGSSFDSGVSLGRGTSQAGSADGNYGTQSAFGNSLYYQNGGATGAGSAVSTTESFDGSSFSSETASSLERAGGCASVI